MASGGSYSSIGDRYPTVPAATTRPSAGPAPAAAGTTLPQQGQAIAAPGTVPGIAPAQVDAEISRINEAVQSISRELRFSVDDATGVTVIRVIDTKTDQVVRQIPSEEVLVISEYLQHGLQGALIDERS